MESWVCLKMGYIANEIAIFRRDNDQQNRWVFWGLAMFSLFSDKPIWEIYREYVSEETGFFFWDSFSTNPKF